MTISIPQWVNDPGDNTLLYDAAALRTMDTLYAFYDGQVLGGRTGVRPGGTGLQVTFTNSLWMIAPGIGAISAVSSGAFGEYRFSVTATESGTIQAPDATNPRKDILVLQLQDKDNGDAQSRVYARYIVGSPNAVPTAPSTPAKSMLLATFTVPASGSVTAVDERVFTVASGAVLPTKVRPGSPYAGMTIFNLTSGIAEVYNGTTWLPLSGGAPTVMVQTVAGSGTWTKPANAKYVQVELWGAGGAGGGAGATGHLSANWAEGAGGGSGGYVRKMFNASDLNATEPFTVGLGGVGGGSTGGAGGSSTFKALTAGGGSGGQAMSAAGATTTTPATSATTAGGGGGSATGGDLNSTGGQGGRGRRIGQEALLTGFGAAAPCGGGTVGTPNAAGNGMTGALPGGGGSGAFGTGASGVYNGGNGSVGKIIVTTYF